MKDLTIWDMWCAAYAMCVGCRLVKTLQLPGDGFYSYVFDDSDGNATRALGEWRQGNSMVPTRAFVSAYKIIRQMSRRQSPQIRNEVYGHVINQAL